MEPGSVAEAEEIQRELAGRVEVPAARVPEPKTVAGLDVSYAVGSDRVMAAAVVVDVGSGTVVDQAIVGGVATFPYVPGLLAFREVPILLETLGRLSTAPDLLLCDGQGLAHPRRCGVACHLGVLTGLPAIGCAKSRFVGDDVEPATERGAREPLYDGGELVGQVLRTQDNVKPMYVSPGHRIGFAQASDIVLLTCTNFRLPDPVRHADRLSRQALRQ